MSSETAVTSSVTRTCQLLVRLGLTLHIASYDGLSASNVSVV